MSKENDDFFKAKKSGQQSKMTFLPAISNHMYPKFFIRITLNAIHSIKLLCINSRVETLS